MTGVPKVLIDRPRAHVAVITLNDPKTLNAFSMEMLEGLAMALDEIDADSDVVCCLLTGAGRGFTSGGNLDTMVSAPDAEPIDLYQAGVEAQRLHQTRTVRRLYAMRKPTVALVNGPAAGAGMALACACDFRLAAASAFFTAAFTRIGRSGDFGLPWFLSRLIGVTRAKEMCFTSSRVTAGEALAIGLVSQVHPDADLVEAGLTFAQAIAGGPPEALARMKDAFRVDELASLDRELELEARNMPIADQSAEGKRFLASFLAQRRDPGRPT